jgi:FimV-like protein
MNSTDSRTRYYAMVMVAKCYADLGDKAKAQELLQQVIDNGPGPERRQARKALRKIK